MYCIIYYTLCVLFKENTFCVSIRVWYTFSLTSSKSIFLPPKTSSFKSSAKTDASSLLWKITLTEVSLSNVRKPFFCN